MIGRQLVGSREHDAANHPLDRPAVVHEAGRRMIEQFGVTSYKVFMFYGGHGLHGKSDDQSSFLMTPPGDCDIHSHRSTHRDRVYDRRPEYLREEVLWQTTTW